jgi:hypothetical protein
MTRLDEVVNNQPKRSPISISSYSSLGGASSFLGSGFFAYSFFGASFLASTTGADEATLSTSLTLNLF